MLKIHSTLLSALFLSPNPQPERKEVRQIYTKLSGRIFPSTELFIQYLNAQSIDIQYELAEKIIQSLCYFSNYPPSFYAIQDVLSIEQLQKTLINPEDKYIPRDHFLHIVNLYLLGIYLFFYNSELYERICFDNNCERQYNLYGNSKVDSVKDFISAWKYFCLFHDVGYSTEWLSNKGLDSKRDKVISSLRKKGCGFRGSFKYDESIRQLCYFSSVQIVAKIIASRFFLDESLVKDTKKQKLLRNAKGQKYIKYNNSSRKTECVSFHEAQISTNFLYGFRKIYSNRCLKFLLPIIGDSSVQVWGIDKEYGRIAFISYYCNSTREMIISIDYQDDDQLLNLAKSPDLVLYDDFELTNFEFIFFCDKDERIDSVYDLISEDYLAAIYTDAKHDLFSRFLSIDNEEEFMEFQLSVYIWLKNKLDLLFVNSALERHLLNWDYGIENDTAKAHIFDVYTGKLIRKSIERAYLDDIEYCCESCLIDFIHQQKKKKTNQFKALNDIIESRIDLFMDNIHDLSDDESLKNTIISVVHKSQMLHIENNEYLLHLFSKVYTPVISLFKGIDKEFDYDYSSNLPTYSSLWNKYIKQRSLSHFGCIPSKVKASYKLKYGMRYDHGMVSSLYTASIFSVYRNALQNANNEQTILLLSILMNICGDFNMTKKKYIDDYSHVFEEVVFAIFIHNLSPSWFVDRSGLKDKKTSIKEPFTFFALICDAMQQWNRPHAILPTAFLEKPNKDACELFNIISTNRKILIDDGKALSKGYKTTIEMLNTMSEYLDDIKDIVSTI